MIVDISVLCTKVVKKVVKSHFFTSGKKHHVWNLENPYETLVQTLKTLMQPECKPCKPLRNPSANPENP